MAEGWGFCPYCRTPRAAPDATMCTGCGRQMPGLTPAASVPPLPPMAAPRSRRPVLSSWAELNTLSGIVGYTFLIWVVVSLAVGLTFGQAVAHDVGLEFSPFSLANADLTVMAAQLAMFSSLVAGLNFRTFAADGAGTLAVVPIGSLTLLAFVARVCARRTLRRNPPSSIADLFVRITIAAAAASLAIYVASSLAVNVYATTIAAPGMATGAGFAASTDPDGLLYVLFPALWIGTAAGVFSLAPARVLVRRAFWGRVNGRAGEAVRFVMPAAAAVRAYLHALIVVSLAVVAGWAGWVILNAQADATGVAFALPSVLAMGPNAALGLALGVTGTVVRYSSSDASLWQSDPWMIAAGVLSLVAPAGYAGFTLGRSRPNATPGEIGAAGLGVGFVALLLLNIASPSAKVAQAAMTGTAGAVSRVTFDLGQAVLVGGAVILAMVVVGFIVGVFTRPATVSAQQPASIPTITV